MVERPNFYILFSKKPNSNGEKGFVFTTDAKKIEHFKIKFSEEFDFSGESKISKESRNDPAALSGAEKADSGFYAEIVLVMRKIKSSLSGFRYLTEVSGKLIPSVRDVYVQNQILADVRESLNCTENCDEYELYEGDVRHFGKINSRISHLDEMDEGEEALPKALLLGLVATFDSIFSEIIQILLRKSPERLFNSDKKISIKDIMSEDSFSEFKERIVSDEISDLMRGSHDEQVKYVEEMCSIKIREKYDRWGEFIEIFERRNLVAHGVSRVNSVYMRKCQNAGYDVGNLKSGDYLYLNSNYLSNSADILIEFSVLLSFVVGLKFSPECTQELYEELNSICYSFIVSEKSHIAANILRSVLNFKHGKVDDRTIKMMTVNLANAYKKIDSNPECVAVLDSIDWSSSSDDFKICVAAIREDIDECCNLVERIAKAEALTMEAFREWPVFDWVREHSYFQKKFEDVFQEPIYVEKFGENNEAEKNADDIKES